MKSVSSRNWFVAAGVAVAMVAGAGAASAAVFPSKLLSATIVIYDQQAEAMDNGVPMMDGSLPETFDDTSVHIDALFSGNILQGGSSTTTGPQANFGSNVPEGFSVGIQPAGTCAALAAGDAVGVTEPFVIPVAELLTVSGFPVTQSFIGLTNNFRFASSFLRSTAPAKGGLFESLGPDNFEGPPWADVTVTSTLIGGELKLDGITDLSELFNPGSLRLTVDLVVRSAASFGGGGGATSLAEAASGGASCLEVPATVVIRPQPTAILNQQ